MTAHGFAIVTPDSAALARLADSLADLLITCVAHGASFGYFAPLAKSRAEAVFRSVIERVDDGSARIVLATMDAGPVGCAVVLAESRETEPHLAELSKLMVAPGFRRRGIARALVAGAETAAIAWGKRRLYLFTSDDGVAPRFYDDAGYERCGRIPQGGRLADGTYGDALIYTKRLKGEPP